MMLIRLSAEDEHFPDVQGVRRYFEDPQSPFRNRGPYATFIFRNQIAEGRLQAGETLLFSYRAQGDQARVVYVATALSGRLPYHGPRYEDWPFCFYVNVASLRRADFPVQQLATELGVAIPASQGWPTIGVADDLESQRVVNLLCGGPGAQV